jgi:hypothetical protein
MRGLVRSRGGGFVSDLQDQRGGPSRTLRGPAPAVVVVAVVFPECVKNEGAFARGMVYPASPVCASVCQEGLAWSIDKFLPNLACELVKSDKIAYTETKAHRDLEHGTVIAA